MPLFSTPFSSLFVVPPPISERAEWWCHRSLSQGSTTALFKSIKHLKSYLTLEGTAALLPEQTSKNKLVKDETNFEFMDGTGQNHLPRMRDSRSSKVKIKSNKVLKFHVMASPKCIKKRKAPPAGAWLSGWRRVQGPSHTDLREERPLLVPSFDQKRAQRWRHQDRLTGLIRLSLTYMGPCSGIKKCPCKQMKSYLLSTSSKCLI